MEFTIHCIQSLKLSPCKHLINKKNASLVARATDALLARSSVTPKGYNSIGQDVEPERAVNGADVLCTWRPRFCLDLFIYVTSDPSEAFLGVVMHGKRNTVEYFRCQEQLEVSSPGGIIFGHLTCDTHEDCSHQLNILVYDGIPNNSYDSIVPVHSRYAWIQHLESELQAMKIAAANVVVQWVGCTSTHDKLYNMQLPHEKRGITLIRTDGSYTLYDFECRLTA